MFHPTGFADLAGKRVGIFGYGVEGRAAEQRLRDVATSLVLVDDAPGRGNDVLLSSEGGLEALAHCDVVLKSPGIPRRRPDVLALEERGVIVTSALNLWLHEIDRSRVVAVTGTKGKSTTTSLIAFCFQCLDEPALALGNLGRPPYDPTIDTTTAQLIVEVSSFQCVDITIAPESVVVTSLGSDHLDWHGSLEAYQSDKLSLTRAPGRHDTFVPESPLFHARVDELGGDVHFEAADTTGLAGSLNLLGAHNDANVALALGVVAKRTGIARDALHALVAKKASSFSPLPGRLTLVSTEDVEGHLLQFVDDGLATSALATIAALEVFEDRLVALVVGGFDRGIDYHELAEVIIQRRWPTLVIAMGDAGKRIASTVRDATSSIATIEVSSMLEALASARSFLTDGGVVLLSPAAPSFDVYRDWRERSTDFARSIDATR